MRGGIRHRHAEEEEESAFVSMTDMTVSFLFIVMVLLAFFASQLNKEDVVPRITHDAVLAARDAAQARVAELERLLAEAEQQRDVARRQLTAVQDELLALTERVQQLEAELAQLRRPNPLEEYVARAALSRLQILQDLRDRLRLEFPDLVVDVSTEGDALRFQGEGLFARGSATLRPEKQRIVQAIAGRLDAILPCYTLGPQARWTDGCNPGLSVIEAVQIEGHTDADGPDLANLSLSTARANATFAAMIARNTALTGHLNTRRQPVLSVAGYGEMRPVVANDTVPNKSTNRRIDLRIIMHTPAKSEEIRRIRALLAGGMAP